jgi:hypothetical protein
LTVSLDNPSANPSLDDNPSLPADLVGIATAWTSIPDPIKTAVKAILAPYLNLKGGE